MIIASLLIIAGIFLLYFGGDYAVEAAVKIARYFNISTAIIAGTIVAFGTSAPELAVSLSAAFSGQDVVAIGNAFGSNIANILLALGLVFCVSIIQLRHQVRFELLMLNNVFHAIVIVVLWQKNIISPFLGGGLFFILVAHTIYQFFQKNTDNVDDIDDAADGHIIKHFLMVSASIAALIIGAQLLVTGAVSIAEILEINPALVALSVVALGTSLPEIFTTIAAARKGESGFVLGNILGSCFFNIGIILGLSAFVTDGLSSSPDLNMVDGPFLAFTMLLFSSIFLFKKSHRAMGVIFLLLYGAYCLHLWWRIAI